MDTDSMITIKWEHFGTYRRFLIPAGSDSYALLMERIKSFIPNFQDNVIYKDDEGDWIMFSSQDEMRAALLLANNQHVFRIYSQNQKISEDLIQNAAENSEAAYLEALISTFSSSASTIQDASLTSSNTVTGSEGECLEENPSRRTRKRKQLENSASQQSTNETKQNPAPPVKRLCLVEALVKEIRCLRNEVTFLKANLHKMLDEHITKSDATANTIIDCIQQNSISNAASTSIQGYMPAPAYTYFTEAQVDELMQHCDTPTAFGRKLGRKLFIGEDAGKKVKDIVDRNRVEWLRQIVAHKYPCLTSSDEKRQWTMVKNAIDNYTIKNRSKIDATLCGMGIGQGYNNFLQALNVSEVMENLDIKNFQ